MAKIIKLISNYVPEQSDDYFLKKQQKENMRELRYLVAKLKLHNPKEIINKLRKEQQ